MSHCYVEMRNSKEAKKAVRFSNGKKLEGREVSVRLVRNGEMMEEVGSSHYSVETERYLSVVCRYFQTIKVGLTIILSQCALKREDTKKKSFRKKI
jgi:RNA recognition motif-containing protein